MNHFPRLALAFVALCVPIAHAAETSAVPFRDVSFDAALKAADAEHKIVFIDFYTTWCGPCKMLDRQTWTDPGVGKLLGEKAVCLKLDAEKEGRPQAKKYAIDAYPTLLLLKPDGTVLDRIVGFREPAAFTQEFTASLAGKPSLARAEAAVQAARAGNEHDQVTAREKLARELFQQGKYEEALTEYLWLFDTGMKAVPSFAGVRTSFLTSEMGRLARRYPPAKTALETRRDAAKARLLSDAHVRQDADDFAALSEALGESESVMAVFEQIPAGDSRRRGFGLRVYRPLLEARRYQEAVEVRPYRSMVSILDMASRDEAHFAQRPELRATLLKTAAGDVEALAGAGDLEHAAALRDRILALDHSDAIKETLRTHLTRAGHPELLASTTP